MGIISNRVIRPVDDYHNPNPAGFVKPVRSLDAPYRVVASDQAMEKRRREREGGFLEKSTEVVATGTSALLGGIGNIGLAVENSVTDARIRRTGKKDATPTMQMLREIGDASPQEKGAVATQLIMDVIGKTGGLFKENLKGASNKIQESGLIKPEHQGFTNPETGEIDPKKIKSVWNWANAVSMGVGSMTPAFAAFAVTKNPAALTLTMGLMEKGDAVEAYTHGYADRLYGGDASKLTNEEIKKVDEMSDYYGVLSGVLESFGPLKFLEKVGGDKVAKPLLMRAVMDVPVEVTRQVLIEGSTEGTQRYAQNLLAKYSGINPEQDLMEGVIDEALAGAAMGGVFGGIAGIAPGRRIDSSQVGIVPQEKKEEQEPGETGPESLMPPVTKLTPEEADKIYVGMKEAAPEHILASVASVIQGDSAQLATLTPEEKETAVIIMESVKKFPGVDENVVEQGIQQIEATGIKIPAREQAKKQQAEVAKQVALQEKEAAKKEIEKPEPKKVEEEVAKATPVEKPVTKKEVEKIMEEKNDFTGKEISSRAKKMGSAQGGFSDWTLDQIEKENYRNETVNLSELLEKDLDLAEYVANGKLRKTKGKVATMAPIVTSDGTVWDGYNRILQAVKDGKKDIVVLKGRKKEVKRTIEAAPVEKPVTKKEVEKIVEKKTVLREDPADKDVEVLKFMNKSEQQKAYQGFLNRGNSGKFDEFVSFHAEDTFHAKSGEVSEIGGSKKINSPLPKVEVVEKKSRFDTVDNLLREIDKPKEGVQGLDITPSEMKQIGKLFENHPDKINQKLRGGIDIAYGGRKDVILGSVETDRGRLYVVAELGKNGKPTGRVRTHGTPIKESELAGRVNEAKPTIVAAPKKALQKSAPILSGKEWGAKKTKDGYKAFYRKDGKEEEVIGTFSKQEDAELAAMKEIKASKEQDSLQANFIANTKSLKGNEKVERLLSNKEAVEIIRKIEAETNPNIRDVMQFELVATLKDKLGNDLGGQMDPETMTITMARNSTREEFIGILREEIGHMARHLMSAKSQKELVEWYRGLSEKELERIFPGDTLDKYQEKYGKRKDYEVMMADEAAQWSMRIKGFYEKSPILKKFHAVLEKLIRLWNTVSGKLKGTIARLDAFNLYGDVFSQEGGQDFARNEWYLKDLREKGNIAGSIKIKETGFSTRAIAHLKKAAEERNNNEGFRHLLKMFNDKHREIYGIDMPQNVADILSEEYVQAIMKKTGKEGYVLGKTEAAEAWKKKRAEREKKIRRILNEKSIDKKELQRQAELYIEENLPASERGKDGLIGNIISLENEKGLDAIFKKVQKISKDHVAAVQKETIQKTKEIERNALRLEKMRQKLRDYRTNVQVREHMRNEAAKYATARLKNNPKTYKLIKAIKNVKKMEEFQELVERVDQMAENHERNLIAKKIKKLLDWNDRMPVAVRKKIREIAQGYKTADLETLIDMHNEIMRFRALGMEIREGAKAYKDAVKNNFFEMVDQQGIKNIDVIDPKMTLNSESRKRITRWMKVKAGLRKFDIATFTPERVFELIDGRTNGVMYRAFYELPHVLYTEWKNALDPVYDIFRSNINVLELTDEHTNKDKTKMSNADRIGIVFLREQYAVTEEGERVYIGRERLIEDNGFTEAEIDAIVLSKKEMAVYNIIRKFLDEMHPKLSETYAKYRDGELGFVEGYFPMVRDKNAAIFGNMEDTLTEMIGRQRYTKANYLKNRTGGGVMPLDTNAFRVFEAYMGQSTHWVKFTPALQQLNGFIDNVEFQKKIGLEASKYVKDYLSLTARMWGTGKIPSPAARTVDEIRKNLTVGKLGYRLSTVIKQPLALLNGAAEIGNYAFEGAADLMDSNWREFMDANSAQMRERAGRDVILAEIQRQGRLAKEQMRAMSGIKFTDRMTAGAVWIGAYRKKMDEMGLSVDFKSPNQIAVLYADKVVRRTQSSSENKDLPQILIGDSKVMWRSFLMFQTFSLTSIYGYIRSDIKLSQDPRKASQQLLFMTSAIAAETSVTIGIGMFWAGLLGIDDEDDDKPGYPKQLVLNVLRAIPVIGQVAGMTEYSSDPIPILGHWRDVYTSFHQMSNAATPETRHKHAIREMNYIMQMFGLPSDQIHFILEKMMFE